MKELSGSFSSVMKINEKSRNLLNVLKTSKSFIRYSSLIAFMVGNMNSFLKCALNDIENFREVWQFGKGNRGNFRELYKLIHINS